MELRTDNVRKVYGSGRGRHGATVAVDRANVQVTKSDFVAIVGESGSGKSTLARMLLGLIEPTEGQVLFNDAPLHRMRGSEKRAYRRSVQAVLQDPAGSLNPRKSVGKAIAEVIRLHGIASGRGGVALRVAEMLETVGLDPELYIDRFPHELSGGQRQRVLIARALAVEPDFIVADEAVSALDVSIKAGILKLMRDLHEQRGIGYVFITHDLEVVKKVATHVYVMRNGAVVDEGPRDTFYTAQRHPYTQELLAAAPVLDIRPGPVPSTPVQSSDHHWKATPAPDRAKTEVPVA